METRELAYRGFGSRMHFDELDVLYQDVPDAAVAANASFIVERKAVQVLAARGTFTPSGAVASRSISLDFVDARGVVRVRNMPALTLAASSGAQAFEWNRAWAVSEWNTGTSVMVPVNDCILDIGFTVRFTAGSIQAGDTWTALSLVLLTIPTGFGSNE